jgi:hypothetical protein
VAPPERAEFHPKPILECLSRHEVDFVLIGGLAGMALGSAVLSYDVDIAYARDKGNLARLATALRELGATLRGAPRDLPFQLDALTLEAGANFTFSTQYGALDVLTDPVGAPSYRQLFDAGSDVSIEGVVVRVVSLDHLIAMKEATGRAKDKLMATEYRTLSDVLRAPEDEG